MDASIAKAMKVAVGISFPSENEGRWLEALSVPGNFRNSHWSCFSETSEPYARVGKDVSCALNMESACHRAGIWVVPRNFFCFVPVRDGAFFVRYARRAAAWMGKLACTDMRISDGQRTASDVVTSWAGGQPHRWASLLAQICGYPTGNGAERPVDVRLAPTEAETSV